MNDEPKLFYYTDDVDNIKFTAFRWGLIAGGFSAVGITAILYVFFKFVISTLPAIM